MFWYIPKVEKKKFMKSEIKTSFVATPLPKKATS